MSVQYNGGVQYNGRCSVHQGDIISTVGDIMSILGGVQYTGDIMSTPGDIMINVGEGHWENS